MWSKDQVEKLFADDDFPLVKRMLLERRWGILFEDMDGVYWICPNDEKSDLRMVNFMCPCCTGEQDGYVSIH